VGFIAYKFKTMKYYSPEVAQYLMAYYSSTEPIDCRFELVRKKDDPEGKEVGILCVDRNALPAVVHELEDVVVGLKLTPPDKLIKQLEQ
jgi:hypothetical protein